MRPGEFEGGTAIALPLWSSADGLGDTWVKLKSRESARAQAEAQGIRFEFLSLVKTSEYLSS